MIEAWVARHVSRLVERAAGVIAWPRTYKRTVVMAGDALLAVAATWLAFSLRIGEWRLLDWPVVRFSLTVIVVWFPIAHLRGIYNAIFRYTGRGTVVSLAVAMLLTGSILVMVYSVITYPGVPRTIAILQPILFLLMIATARIVGRYILVDLFHARPVQGRLRRVMIYGAGSTGRQLANSLAGESGTQLMCYVDDDPALARQRLDDVPVWHSSALQSVIDTYGITDVVLAVRSASFARRQEIVRQLERHSVSVKTLPPIREFLDGTVTVNALRPIDVEDVLGREQVKPDAALLRSAITHKVVMVTGAGGSIGSEICRQIAGLNVQRLILVDSSEFALFEIGEELKQLVEDPSRLVSQLVNVADAAQIEAAIAEHSPDTIFHAAAYKHVPLVEANVVAGVRNNIFGTLYTAKAALACGVERFVLISTDKAVRPPNVMGATKRCCELILQALAQGDGGTVFTMVRFGNVLNSSGSVIPLFRKQIAAGGPVTVTHRDVTRYFMTIPEASQLVIQAGSMARGGEVFLLDMGEPVRIWDLAASMIRLTGLTVRDEDNPAGDVEIVETGLRPGEKLFEELLLGDNAQPTSHERIRQGAESSLAWPVLEAHLAQLSAAVAENSSSACREILSELVPSLGSAPEIGQTQADDPSRAWDSAGAGARDRTVPTALAMPTAGS